MVVPRYAIIPTYNRIEHVTNLVSSLKAQGCTHVIVIDNGEEQLLSSLWFRVKCGMKVSVIHDDEHPPNLYKMWNHGFEVIKLTADIMRETLWDVIVLNDDAELPDGWLDYVCEGLRGSYGSPAVACTDPYGILPGPLLKVQPDHNIQTRMCPWAFVTRGELGLRADETMRWWYGDTDYDWQACQAGGVLLLPGKTTKNLFANSTTVGELAEQAGRDGETFKTKWGRLAW